MHPFEELLRENKIWAAQMGLAFYDLDEIIEIEYGKTIAAIFEKEGEDYFRKIETIALHSFTEKKNCIVACGGGTACFNDNIHWMNKNGVTVFLNETESNIYDHIKKDDTIRPLINNQDEETLRLFIKNKLQSRIAFYNQSQLVLQSHQLNKEKFLIISKYINDLLH